MPYYYLLIGEGAACRFDRGDFDMLFSVVENNILINSQTIKVPFGFYLSGDNTTPQYNLKPGQRENSTEVPFCRFDRGLFCLLVSVDGNR